METLVPVDLPPGLSRNGTPYQSKNRWINGNLIRFYEGTLRPVGGWTLAVDVSGTTITASGFPRASYAWRKNDGTAWLAVGTTGTTTKLYAFSAAAITDITPGGLVAGAADGRTVSGTAAYGGGNYGAFLYGGSDATYFVDADTWSLDNFGEMLVACLTSDGKIYGSTPTAVATQVTNSPTGVRAVFVTPERMIVALGPTAASPDVRTVTWCSQEAPTVWAPLSTNSAGDFTLQTNGRPIAGRRMDRESLIWTDADVWSMQYIGGTLIYGFARRGDNCGLIGPLAVTTAEGSAFWMGSGKFFRYDGATRVLPCDVSDYVFGDINLEQRAKIQAVPIPDFSEVWWFYPSASQGGLENDRYVSVNYRTGVWATGTLARGAGVGSGVFEHPEFWGTDGKLYNHETGFNHDTTTPFVESGPFEIGQGDRIVRVQRVLPDERLLGQVNLTFYTKFQPMGAEATIGPITVTASTSVRLTGRQVRLRLTEVTPGDWRVGTFRFGVVPGGSR